MSETGHTERYNELYEADEPPAAIPVLTNTPVLRDAFATVPLSAQTSRMDSAAVKIYGVQQAAGCSPPAQVSILDQAPQVQSQAFTAALPCPYT